jgi:hypothetical protein
MNTLDPFSDAAAALMIEVVEQLDQAAQDRIVEAMTRGARLKVSVMADGAHNTLVALDLVDEAGRDLRLWYIEGRPPTRN